MMEAIRRDIEKPMPKTNENPLGINVLLCPICLNYSFFARSRSNAVKHVWECYSKKTVHSKGSGGES